MFHELEKFGAGSVEATELSVKGFVWDAFGASTEGEEVGGRLLEASGRRDEARGDGAKWVGGIEALGQLAEQLRALEAESVEPLPLLLIAHGNR